MKLKVEEYEATIQLILSRQQQSLIFQARQDSSIIENKATRVQSSMFQRTHIRTMGDEFLDCR